MITFETSENFDSYKRPFMQSLSEILGLGCQTSFDFYFTVVFIKYMIRLLIYYSCYYIIIVMLLYYYYISI